jgi:hypothetical protein
MKRMTTSAGFLVRLRMFGMFLQPTENNILNGFVRIFYNQPQKMNGERERRVFIKSLMMFEWELELLAGWMVGGWIFPASRGIADDFLPHTLYSVLPSF